MTKTNKLVDRNVQTEERTRPIIGSSHVLLPNQRLIIINIIVIIIDCELFTEDTRSTTRNEYSRQIKRSFGIRV